MDYDSLDINSQNLLSTLQEVLSASRQIRSELEQALSSVPAHPYERIKQEYLEKDFTPLTIEQIPDCYNFCPKTCSEQISSISVTLDNNIMTHFAEVSSSGDFSICNAFIELSSTENEKEYFVNKNKASGYLKFLETVRTIPVELINTYPEEVARKLISHYINTLS